MAPHIAQVSTKPPTPGQCGLPKIARESIDVRTLGAQGDHNEYRTTVKRGTPDRALLLYTTDMIAKLNSRGWPVRAGDLGENITIDAIAYDTLAARQRYRAGGVVLEITEACYPCKNLAQLPYVGQERIKEFIRALIDKRGWYAKVLEEGTVKPGDRFTRA